MPRDAAPENPIFVGESTPSEPRFKLYRLCPCFDCSGTGRSESKRCRQCRGEGRVLDTVATAETPEAVGLALVTLGREGEWAECPVGLLDTEGEKGQKWIVSPWLPSPRNVSDAGRLLRSQR